MAKHRFDARQHHPRTGQKPVRKQHCSHEGKRKQYSGCPFKLPGRNSARPLTFSTVEIAFSAQRGW